MGTKPTQVLVLPLKNKNENTSGVYEILEETKLIQCVTIFFLFSKLLRKQATGLEETPLFSPKPRSQGPIPFAAHRPSLSSFLDSFATPTTTLNYFKVSTSESDHHHNLLPTRLGSSLLPPDGLDHHHYSILGI